MSLRRQLPAYSPIPGRALAHGLKAALLGDRTGRRAVEARVRDRFGARDVLLVDSGTSALRLALAWAAAETPGRPVALPAYSCFDLVTAAVGAGAPISFYDLDPATLEPDVASFESVLAEGPCAVVAVHLYGMAVDIPALDRMPRAAGVALVEDAAQGVGSELGGAPLGSLGSVSVLSFGRGKGLTGGSGGALLANDEHGGAALDWIRSHGWLETASRGWRDWIASTVQWALGRPEVYAIPTSMPFLHLGETRYRPPTPPRRPSTASMAMLDRTWEASLEEAGVRQRTAARLLAEWSPNSGLFPVHARADAEPAWLRFPVLAEHDSAARTLRSAPARALGIMPGYPVPLADLDAARELTFGEETSDHPGAVRLTQRLFTLPTHNRLRETDLRQLDTLLRTGRLQA